MNNTVKLHFNSSKNAIKHSIDGSCYAGECYKSGRVKTWIAHVEKQNPNETIQQVFERINKVQ